MDVDHFKMLNDEYGHAFGNTYLLRLLAFSKKSCAPPTLSRDTEEEFVIIFSILRLHSLLPKGFELSSQNNFDTDNIRIRRPVTVSIGISTCPSDGGDGNVILEKADEAMYTAKKNGRNQVKLWSEADG